MVFKFPSVLYLIFAISSTFKGGSCQSSSIDPAVAAEIESAWSEWYDYEISRPEFTSLAEAIQTALPSAVLASETAVFTNSDGIIYPDWVTMLPSSIENAFEAFETEIVAGELYIASSILAEQTAEGSGMSSSMPIETSSHLASIASVASSAGASVVASTSMAVTAVTVTAGPSTTAMASTQAQALTTSSMTHSGGNKLTVEGLPLLATAAFLVFGAMGLVVM